MTTPLVIRPVKLTRVCRALAVVVVVAFALVGASLRATGEGAATFALADQIAMAGLGVLLAAGVLLLTRAQVVADERGLRVRGLLGEKDLPWQVVVGITLNDGEPWASLELHDDERISLLAVQANDGDRAIRSVLALRALLRASHSS